MIIIEHAADSGGKKRCQAEYPFYEEHTKDLWCLIGEAEDFENGFEFNTAYLCGNCTDAFIYALAVEDNAKIEFTKNGYNLFSEELV